MAAAQPQQGGLTKLLTVKLVLLGEMSVGKSSIVLQFAKGIFDSTQETTIGAAYLTQTISVDDVSMKFEIWDTAGQERYHSLAPMYYRGAQAAIVVYDVTNPESFTRAQAWVKELQAPQRQTQQGMIIALAGNKADLKGTAQYRVMKETAAIYAEQHDLLFLETSAKSNANIPELFELIAKKIPRQTIRPQSQNVGNVSLTDPQAPPQRSGSTGCC